MQFPVSPETISALTDIETQKTILNLISEVQTLGLKATTERVKSEESVIWDALIKEHDLDTTTHDWVIQPTEDGFVVVSQPKGES